MLVSIISIVIASIVSSVILLVCGISISIVNVSIVSWVILLIKKDTTYHISDGCSIMHCLSFYPSTLCLLSISDR